MSDLIDRSEFLKGFSYHAPEERFTPSEVAYLLGKAPTVDAVAVVRCRDCKNSNKIAGNETMRHCWNLRGKSNGSGFSMVCNYGYCDEGERKEPADGRTY